MPNLSLFLFGSFQTFLNDQPLNNFRTVKAQALLIYLVAERDAHRRETLMNLLWPGMPDHSARHNLRQVLYFLKGALPEEVSQLNDAESLVSPILTNRQTIQLNPLAMVEADIERFTDLSKAVQAHSHTNLIDCSICRQNLEEAVGLYRSDFLSDFFLEDSNKFEEWAHGRRETFRRQVLDALEVLTAMAIRRQAFPQAEELANRQLEIDQLRESSYRQQMELLALSGRREEALAVYQTCRRILAVELSMQPASRTTAVYEKIKAGELDFDAPASSGVSGYDIKEKIGAGTYGIVHRAIQPTINREVAVKIIRPRLSNNPEFIRRFEDEAQTIARLEHPHIVPLYNYWRSSEGAYLVMRYFKRGSLLAALKNGPWKPERAADLLDEIGAALSYAHQAGVIHRDIKPANILLDKEGHAYLSDFGIARPPGLDSEGQPIGLAGATPEYVSPEQILNEPVGPPTDIYNLGLVVYELLTGEKPFGDASLDELLHRHVHEPLPLIKHSRPDVPARLDAVVQKAAAKRPADRFDGARTFAAAFRQAIEGPAPAPNGQPGVIKIYNPYKGLKAFNEADAEDFYGREALVNRLVARLRSGPAPQRDTHAAAGRFLTVVGPSGSGKSSVVKAGLMPALRQEAVPGSHNWFMAEMVPGTHPLEELELALWPVSVDPPPSLVEPMQRDTRGLLRTVRRILPRAEGSQLLLFIDQFEELFTQVDDDQRRSFFLESLLTAVTDPRSPLRVVITLRADFYDRPLQIHSLGQLIKATTEIVLPLTPEELTGAVREPARRVGVEFEAGLAEAIVADVADQPAALPLLQYALTELFERRRGPLMTRAAYEGIGGVRGALARRGAEIFAALDELGQTAARQIFLRLVTLGEGVEDTRRRVLQSELEALDLKGLSTDQAADGDWRESITSVLHRFSEGRLLTFDSHPVSHLPTVEVAHEALLREWPLLREWLDQERASVRLQRQLGRAAVEWEAAGRDDSFLLRGGQLSRFSEWFEDERIALTRSERSFLDASLAARLGRQIDEENRRQRELRTVRQLASEQEKRAEEQAATAATLRGRARVLAGAVVVSVLLAVVAFGFFRSSSRNADLAAIRAAEAQANLERAVTNEAAAGLAAADAQRSADLAATREAEAVAERAAAQASFLEAERIRLASQAQNALDRGEGGELPALLALRSLALGYSTEADAALMSALERGFARQQFGGHSARINKGSFTSNGLQVVTSGFDGTARLWDTQSGREIRRFESHNTPLWMHQISPDDRRLLTSGFDGTARLWDIETGEELHRLTHDDVASGGGFSPDGRRVVTTSGADIYIWDTTTGTEIRRFEGHPEGVFWAEFSPDGTLIASGGQDSLVRLWEAETGRQIRQFRGHSGWIGTVTFSPDGRYLASSSADRTVRIWDVETGAEVRRLVGHSGEVLTVEFSPDGSRILTGSRDRTARVWDILTGEEIRQIRGHTGSVFATFSPDGSYIMTAGDDRIARLYAFEPVQEPRVVINPTGGHTANHIAAALSPDEQYVLADHGEGVLRLWQTFSSDVVRDYSLRGDSAAFIAFSASGAQAIAGSGSGQIYYFDIQSDADPKQIEGHSGGVWAGAFSPDDRLIVTGGEDGTLKIWEADSGRLIEQLSGHDGPVHSVAFSPDGRRIASGGEDQTVRVWDAASGAEESRFDSRDGAVLGVAFSSDGRMIAAAHADHVVTLWNGAAGQESRRFSGHTDQVTHVAFDANDQYVLTGSADQSARLWDVATGRQVHVYPDHGSFLLDAGFSADGQTVYTLDQGNVLAWRATLDTVIAYACSRIARDFTAAERDFYRIGDEPTCSDSAERQAGAEPVWTSVTPNPVDIVSLDLASLPGQEESVVTQGLVVRVEDISDLENIASIEGTRAQLVTDSEGATLQVYTSGLTPGHAVTLWMIAFNYPENCSDGACGPDDAFPPPGNQAAGATVRAGGGLVVKEHGRAYFSEFMPVGEAEGPFPVGLLEPFTAEIHFLLRTHGPVVEGVAFEQLTTPGGGCSNFPPRTGEYECADIQAGRFVQGE